MCILILGVLEVRTSSRMPLESMGCPILILRILVLSMLEVRIFTEYLRYHHSGPSIP
jgi:hypothetical protein